MTFVFFTSSDEIKSAVNVSRHDEVTLCRALRRARDAGHVRTTHPRGALQPERGRAATSIPHSLANVRATGTSATVRAFLREAASFKHVDNSQRASNDILGRRCSRSGTR